MKKIYEVVIDKVEYKDFLKKTFMTSTIVLGVALLVMFAGTFFIGIAGRIYLMIPVSFVVFILIMLYNIWTNFGKGMKAFHVTGLDKRNITYIFEEKSLKIITENTKSQVKYKKFYKITQTQLSILFYVNKVSAFIVPKRIFDKSDLEELNNIISTGSVLKK